MCQPSLSRALYRPAGTENLCNLSIDPVIQALGCSPKAVKRAPIVTHTIGAFRWSIKDRKALEPRHEPPALTRHRETWQAKPIGWTRRGFVMRPELSMISNANTKSSGKVSRRILLYCARRSKHIRRRVDRQCQPLRRHRSIRIVNRCQRHYNQDCAACLSLHFRAIPTHQGKQGCNNEILIRLAARVFRVQRFLSRSCQQFLPYCARILTAAIFKRSLWIFPTQ